MAEISLIQNRRESIKNALRYLRPFKPLEAIDVMLYHLGRRDNDDQFILIWAQKLPDHQTISMFLSLNFSTVRNVINTKQGLDLQIPTYGGIITNLNYLEKREGRMSFNRQLACLELRERFCEIPPNNIHKLRRDVKKLLRNANITCAYLASQNRKVYGEYAFNELRDLLQAYLNALSNPNLEKQFMASREEILNYKEDKIRAVVTLVWMIMMFFLMRTAINTASLCIKTITKEVVNYASMLSLHVGLLRGH